jgi:hypothetical protein
MAAVVPLERVLAQEGEADANASVRFIQASPDAPALDLLIDGQAIAQGLEFGAVTEFASLSDGDQSLQVVPSGSQPDAALIDEEISTDGDSAYTVAITNLLNAIELQVYKSNLDDLNEGESRVRFVNLSPDEDNVDLTQVGGDEWFDDVEFGEATDHRDVPEGTYELDVRVHDTETSLASASGLQVNRGIELTLVLIGTLSADNLTIVPLETGVNAACSHHLGISDLAEDACVRITHAAVDAPVVDVYIADSIVAEALEPGSTSEFVAVPAGDDRTFALVPAGGTLEDNLLESDVDLSEGQATDVVIGGAVEDLKVINSDLDLSPLATDQARVRAINLSDDVGAIDIAITDGDTLFGDVGFESVTDPILMNADTYDIQVRPEGDDSVLFRSESLAIDPGLSYNLIATGSVDAGTFTILVVSAPAQLRTGELAGTTVASPDATPLDETSPTPVPELDATPTT